MYIHITNVYIISDIFAVTTQGNVPHKSIRYPYRHARNDEQGLVFPPLQFH